MWRGFDPTPAFLAAPRPEALPVPRFIPPFPPLLTLLTFWLENSFHLCKCCDLQPESRPSRLPTAPWLFHSVRLSVMAPEHTATIRWCDAVSVAMVLTFAVTAGGGWMGFLLLLSPSF